MAMNYTTLVADKSTEGSIKYFVRHSEVPSDYILERAQDAIYQVLRVREMVKRLEGTITTGDTTLVLPTDTLEIMSLFRTGSNAGRLIMLDQEHFEARLGADANGDLPVSVPCFCTYDQTTIYFDTEADDDYPYRLWYVQKPAMLSGSNLTNFLTTRYGNILEAMCKHYAYEHRENDNKAAAELEKAMAYIQRANEEYDMFRQNIQTELYWSREG